MPDLVEPRLAVLVSGQFRVHDGLERTLGALNDIKHDLFVATWRARGIKIFGWIGSQASDLLGTAIGEALPVEWFGNYPTLFNQLPALKACIEARANALQPVTLETLSRYQPAAIDVEDDELYIATDVSAQADDNTEKMLYKMLRGLKLIAAYERALGIKYTHIMRIRPDMSIEGFDQATLLSNVLYFDWLERGDIDGAQLPVRLGDNLIIGPVESFTDVAVGTFMKARRRRICEQAGTDPHWFLAETARAVMDPELIGRLHGTSVAWHTDEWPRNEFLLILEDQVKASPNDDISSGFLMNIQANTLYEAGDYQNAWNVLQRIPQSRVSTLPILKTLALAAAACGDTAASAAANAEFQRLWNNAPGHIKDNTNPLRLKLNAALGN